MEYFSVISEQNSGFKLDRVDNEDTNRVQV